GGLGTRMRPLTANVPKSLVPVLGRPFAELQLEWLASQEVTDVIYSIGYRGSTVRTALGDGRRFGVTLTYVDEGNELLGTAGARVDRLRAVRRDQRGNRRRAAQRRPGRPRRCDGRPEPPRRRRRV